MMMARSGSRSIGTSQKVRIVLTPTPSGCGHIIMAGSVFFSTGLAAGTGAFFAAAGGGCFVAVPRDCAESAPEANSSAVARAQVREAGSLTRLFVDARQR